MSPSELPSDAVFKGYREVVVQNVILKRDNVLYKVAQYYSPGEGKLYSTPVSGYTGEFGAELQALRLTLHNVCDATQGSLEKLMKSLGVLISSSTINNILHSQSTQMQAEQKAMGLAMIFRRNRDIRLCGTLITRDWFFG